MLGGIHIYFLIGVKRHVFVVMNWFSNYVMRSKGARLITGMEGLSDPKNLVKELRDAA